MINQRYLHFYKIGLIPVSIKRLMILRKELVVEVEKMEDFQNLKKALYETFGQEGEAEWILKK